MHDDLAEQVAWAMETEVALLPLLPALLADLHELGTSADEIVTALKDAGVQPGAYVLDLGCGKGAVAVALAEHLGVHVEGIDAFVPFLEAARALAAKRGVSNRCNFREGDLHAFLGQPGSYDAVLLLSVGPVSGDHHKTVANLRTLVRPGGLIVIDDGFLAEGTAPIPEYEAYVGHAETLRRLTVAGDLLVMEIISDAEETRALNERNTDLIRQRARTLKARHPDLSNALEAYVARQELESERLGTTLICATWVLQRA